MGQTLTHGVYLPDEGERNCYSGLAANWQILDNSVGTIASHTTQIAGKAPLVHTHTKSDITDFPAYGNAAGTICEGNDSRLSDARTPVAHTHTKSDVTDLFNSANTWTGANVYSGDSTPTLKFKNTSLDISSLPGSNLGIHIDYLDKNNAVVGGWNYIKGPDGTTRTYIELVTKNSSNQEIRRTLRFDTDQNGVNWQFYPSADTSLGTSSNKWKSFNGINPGALSLPDTGYTSFYGNILTVDGTTRYNLSFNAYGWAFITINNHKEAYIDVFAALAERTSIHGTEYEPRVPISISFPVAPGRTYGVLVNAPNGGLNANFFVCRGNVS